MHSQEASPGTVALTRINNDFAGMNQRPDRGSLGRTGQGGRRALTMAAQCFAQVLAAEVHWGMTFAHYSKEDPTEDR